ncbi:MAG TPA: hypothetical protein VGQ81_04805 [Acidobacteriota bacterium]|jgi:hypothetical protein|nr:hypothetical protein [Acidobacteriota bacterium]
MTLLVGARQLRAFAVNSFQGDFMTAKFTSRTTWRAKLEKDQEPKVVDIPPKMTKRFGFGKMLIPKPLDVDALIRRVKPGQLVTQTQLRERLAKDFGVDVTCPMTTGIFIRIAAEAAEEDLQQGRNQITPYWRVIKDDGSLNEKFPGGIKAQTAYLKKEGHQIEPHRGKKPPKVRDFEKSTVQL